MLMNFTLMLYIALPVYCGLWSLRISMYGVHTYFQASISNIDSTLIVMLIIFVDGLIKAAVLQNILKNH